MTNIKEVSSRKPGKRLTILKVATVGAAIYIIVFISFTHVANWEKNQDIPERSFDFSRRCSIGGKTYGCTPVEGVAVSSGKESAPDAKCLGGKAAWGFCVGGNFLCEMNGNIKDMSLPTDLQLLEKDLSFCSIDRSWWVCIEVSSKVKNHPIGRRSFDCLGDDVARGICNQGESLCLLPGGTWLEMHVPIVSSETAPTNTPNTDDLTKLFLANKRSQSGEDEYAWKNLFYGKTRGTFLEMGALDGELFSNSWAFERALNWTGVLIEANPIIKAAVCAEPTTAEFVFPAPGSDADLPVFGAVGGLPQYLTDAFRATHYGDGPVVRQLVACVPLTQILDGLGARDFDLFSLDVEGAELAVLRTLDLVKVRVGVMVVEANGLDPVKDASVRSLLAHAGYTLHASVGGSDWFTAPGFRPSAAPH